MGIFPWVELAGYNGPVGSKKKKKAESNVFGVRVNNLGGSGLFSERDTGTEKIELATTEHRSVEPHGKGVRGLEVAWLMGFPPNRRQERAGEGKRTDHDLLGKKIC